MQTSIHKRTVEYSLIIIAITLLVKLLCIGSSDLLAEEAYYWNYSMHLDMGYLDHPPMVALLIKVFTSIFGTNEFGVRIGSIICWLGTAFFSFKLTRLIKHSAGLFTVFLLAILPFFFIHSLIMTPDLPLIVCWSASLYYLYRALVINKPTSWYIAGVWLGLGMLSKYTIVLLGLATLVYLIIVPQAQRWFLRKEPYLCLFITALLFTPVIYWNATHEWASFAFQGTRRLEDVSSFTFHQLLGLLLVFLTPLGVLGFLSLFRKKTPERSLIDVKTRRFLQIFTVVPLAVFSVFSISHEIKFNWIGPSLLAILPWLAILMDTAKPTRRLGWLITAIILLIIYCGMLFCIISGTPENINQRLFSKYIAWSDLTRQIHKVAVEVETQMHQTPLIVPTDVYNIASELTFYQAKLVAQRKIPTVYTVLGSDLFGHDSLMYRYWSQDESIAGKVIILVDENPAKFESPHVSTRVIALSDTKTIWSYSQGASVKIRKYYYKIVRMK